MQPEARATERWPTAPPPTAARSDVPAEAGSDVSVLAGRTPRGALRLGARLFPLRRWMARRPAAVGAEVALTASLLDQLPTGPTVVLVVSPGVDVASIVDQLLLAVPGTLPPTEVLTIGVAHPEPVSVDDLAAVETPAGELSEALVAAVTTARRAGMVTEQGNSVLLVQPFVPAATTAVAHA
ncbi:MAG TPA: hypothetical protein VNP92_34745, partial [Actinophytocola sp.]|nr:hypothetical protein [Actinophytocola sp.]